MVKGPISQTRVSAILLISVSLRSKGQGEDAGFVGG